MDDSQTHGKIISIPIFQGEIRLIGAETQMTVGAAGGASALPATPALYLKWIVENTEYVMPLYAVS